MDLSDGWMCIVPICAFRFCSFQGFFSEWRYVLLRTVGWPVWECVTHQVALFHWGGGTNTDNHCSDRAAYRQCLWTLLYFGWRIFAVMSLRFSWREIVNQVCYLNSLRYCEYLFVISLTVHIFTRAVFESFHDFFYFEWKTPLRRYTSSDGRLSDWLAGAHDKPRRD